MSSVLNRFQFLLPMLAVGGFTFVGCSDECERASDCLTGEVCYIGVCTPATTNNSLCQSDADCNNGAQTGDFKCASGRCVVDPDASPTVCQRTPECFDTGGRTPQNLQTMTATTGVVLADQSVAMTQVVAVRAGLTQDRVHVIAQDQNGTPTRYMCVSVTDATGGCNVIQVSEGPPTMAGANIYEGRSCTVMLDVNAQPGTLVGTASGVVTDCDGNAFTASADFEVAIQN